MYYKQMKLKQKSKKIRFAAKVLNRVKRPNELNCWQELAEIPSEILAAETLLIGFKRLFLH